MTAVWLVIALSSCLFGGGNRKTEMILTPSPVAVVLRSPESTQQMAILLQPLSQPQKDNTKSLDVTRRANYHFVDPTIATIDEHGLISPKKEGTTELQVVFESARATIPVTVVGLQNPIPVSFSQQIIPLLTKAGCNAGGCHGKAEGQNGFKLSVFGYNPEADYRAIVWEGKSRRVIPGAGKDSLLVTKALALVPHGGGKKLADGSLAHRRLLRWIAEGMQAKSAADAPVVSLAVEPADCVLEPGGARQLRVTATDAAGRASCVTAEAGFDSNAVSVLRVDRGGYMEAGQSSGTAAVLVRYQGQVAVCRVTIPRPGVTFEKPISQNFIDDLAWEKLRQLGIPPSPLADDATFCRRLYLDLLGTLPTADEARAFLANHDPKKREKLVDQLLARPEYADYWTMRWANLLRIDRDLLSAPGAVGMTNWLHRQFAENRPFDRMVRELLTAEGVLGQEGPVGFYFVVTKPEVMSRSISQLFLGVRIECAQCHQHPSDRWSQGDYQGIAGFFTGVRRKTVFGSEAIVAGPGEDLIHPRTKKVVPAHALGEAAADFSAVTDRRQVLADWVTSKDNRFFSRALANRIWANYFGKGLVDPVDDLRATNPASNEPLLAALSDYLKSHDFDIKQFTRLIVTSRLYQLGPPTESNRSDEQFFSHASSRSIPAEVLLDAISQVTGSPEKFNGWPVGVRATQLWDNRVSTYFLALFGRPARTSVCECERSGEPSISQALHLLNATEIASKIENPKGWARRLADSNLADRKLVDEIYLGLLARFPTEEERQQMLTLFPAGSDSATNRRAAVEDALWSLLNTKEFVFNH